MLIVIWKETLIKRCTFKFKFRYLNHSFPLCTKQAETAPTCRREQNFGEASGISCDIIGVWGFTVQSESLAAVYSTRVAV